MLRWLKKNKFHYHVLIVRTLVFGCDTFRHTYAISSHFLLLLTFHVPLTHYYSPSIPLKRIFQAYKYSELSRIMLKRKRQKDEGVRKTVRLQNILISPAWPSFFQLCPFHINQIQLLTLFSLGTALQWWNYQLNFHHHRKTRFKHQKSLRTLLG